MGTEEEKLEKKKTKKNFMIEGKGRWGMEKEGDGG